MHQSARSHSSFLILALVLLLTNCKVAKPTVTRSPDIRKDSLVIAIDTVPKQSEKNYLITQKGDTLDSLFQEVDIAINRLLPDTVTIAGVGDIMMGTKFPDPSYLPSKNGEYL